MRVSVQGSLGQHVSATARGLALDGMPEDVAEPIRAGMRARATADLCEALEIPAVLLDAAGRVLHATSLAASALTSLFSVARGRPPIANSPELDQQLQELRSAAFDQQHAIGTTVRIPIDSDPVSLTMVRYGDPSPCQQLRLLLIVGEHPPLLVSAISSGERTLHS